MRKKVLVTIIAITVMATMAACSSGKPDTKEILEAISKGTITVEDAQDRGWIDEKWIEENIEKTPAVDKSKIHLLGEFTTSTIQGEEFTLNDVDDAVFIFFFNPDSPAATESIETLNRIYDQIRQGDAEVLGVMVGGSSDTEIVKDCKFTVINYNDSLEKAMGDMIDMIDPDGFTGAWNIKTSFRSAWYLKINEEDLLKTAADIKKISESEAEVSTGDDGTNEPAEIR